MRRWLLFSFLALAISGCAQPVLTPPPPSPDAVMFAPAKMRILPAFTRIYDWSGDGRPDGIEALVEFEDQFNDTTKSTGRLIFELFDYRAGPDPRGDRVVNPWIGTLNSIADQRQHWDRTSRAYSFLLAWPQIDPSRRYVLTASFEPVDGDRQFDRIILEPGRLENRRDVPSKSTTQPQRRPSAP